jgi:L-asparaginase
MPSDPRAPSTAADRKPRVVVVFTGGTIAMRRDAAAGGAVPTLDGAAILALTPGLDAIAAVEPIDWGLVPASHLRFAQILELARLLAAALERPDVDGAVVVQGTDTIEETAFAFDLLVGTEKPVVVVGAMRAASDDGYDGPANLRDAIRAAGHEALRGQGTVVVMGRRILPADDARKVHTHAYDAFDAPNFGALGRIVGDDVVVRARRSARRRLPAIPAAAAEPIALVTAVVAMDGSPLRMAVAGGARGAVVAATGAGNTDADLLEAAREAMAAGVPVVLATRAGAGRVTPTYAFPGGGATWERAGAISAAHLAPTKARIALALGLGAGLDQAGLRRLFAE